MLKKELKAERDRKFTRSQRDEYKASLEHDIRNLDKAGCSGGMVDNLKERLACIEWLESNDDPRPLDTGTMNEYRRFRDGLR